MPQFEIKVIEAKKIWSKGDVSIYDLTLDYEGQEMKAKTYSKAIATPDWAGTVETYEKGDDTFVRQPKKEQSYGGRGGRQHGDSYTMYLSYAKDLAVASVHEGEFNKELFSALIEAAEAGGAQLYASRPDAIATPSQGKKTIEMDDIKIDDVDKAVDKAFGGGTKEPEGEEPWSKDKPKLPA